MLLLLHCLQVRYFSPTKKPVDLISFTFKGSIFGVCFILYSSSNFARFAKTSFCCILFLFIYFITLNSPKISLHVLYNDFLYLNNPVLLKCILINPIKIKGGTIFSSDKRYFFHISYFYDCYNKVNYDAYLFKPHV